MMSKKWMDTLPPDLQKIVRDNGSKVTTEITPWVKEFFAEQDKICGSQRRQGLAAAGRRVRRR